MRTARTDIKQGHFAQAHERLLAIRDTPGLSAREQREVADDLCLTEFKLGAPAYPLAEQQQACAKGVNAGGAQSPALLAQVEQSERAAQLREVDQAIADSDLARAEDAIARYQRLPGADRQQIAAWSHELWAIVRRQDATAASSHRHAIQPAIAAVARQYPQLHGMNDRAFTGWVRRNLIVDGTSLVTSVEVNQHTMTLRVPDDQLRVAALHLDKFVKANDAMVARCDCAGSTNVALQRTNLPAYVIRLDPDTRQSEVLVLTPR